MKKVFSIISLIFFLFVIANCGEPLNNVPTANAGSVNYDLWEDVLQVYVNDQGMVNYPALKNNRQTLDRFIKEEIENTNVSSLTPTEQKAFWINAYNALTLQLIIDNYPTRGIRTINWGRPWSIKMKVASRRVTLGDIEHKILRPLGDPRIHFAINCASIGCPKLPNTYFDPNRLDEQLERETQRFILDPSKVRLDRKENTLYHSTIFKWFKEDFLIEHESLLSYISQYMTDRDQQYIKAAKGKIRLKKLEYDWGLNTQ